MSLVLRPFRFISPSGGYDTDGVGSTLAMADCQQVRLSTHSHQDKALLPCGVVWVNYQASKIVSKNSFGLLKGDAMLPLIDSILADIPCKAYFVHAESVVIS